MGLLDQFTNMSPEQNQGLLAAAAQILQRSGDPRRPFGFGQALGAGIETYQGSTEAARQLKLHEAQQAQLAQMRELQMQQQRGELSDQATQRTRQQQIDGAARDSVRSGAGAMTFPTSFGMPEQAPDEFDSKGYIDRLMKIDPMMAMQARAQFAPKAKELKETTNEIVDGKTVKVNWYKDGSHEVVNGMQPRDPLKFLPVGGKTVGVNEYTGTPGATIEHAATPGDVLQDRRARERLNFDKQQASAGGGQGKPPQGYRWGPNGDLVAIPGGPAGKTAAASEGERKAATLLQRLEGSQAQLTAALTENPDAAKPGLIAQGMRGLGAETLANSMAVGSERQRVEAAQLDMLDAALTLGTGAAYTREQLEGYRRSYFPQIGDSKDTIRDKQARLGNVIDAAYTQAGRAAPKRGEQAGAPQPPKPAGQPAIRRYNPATGKIE